jgi:hypothetical protein
MAPGDTKFSLNHSGLSGLEVAYVTYVAAAECGYGRLSELPTLSHDEQQITLRLRVPQFPAPFLVLVAHNSRAVAG